MKFKKILAFSLAAAMVAGSCITAFASEPVGSVDGTGAIEYDDSTDIVYDSITVPSLAADTYKFEIDPEGLLLQYGGEEYVSGKSVYFTATKERAKIVAKDKDTKIYKETYTTKAKDSGKDYWSAIVTANTGTDDSPIYTVADNLYLWTPKSTGYTGTGASGSDGEYTALTKDNITKYFDVTKVDTAFTVALRPDYKAKVTASGVVCDGNIYEKGYTEVTTKDTVGSDNFETVVDSNDDPLSNYVTVTSGALSAITKLYTDDTTGKKALATTDVTYVAAKQQHTDTSDVVYVTNKSTKKKTVTATVKLVNGAGLTVRNSSTFENTDKEASIYIAALSQKTGDATATATALAVDGEDVKATFSVDIDGTTDAGITYQTENRNNAGGHVYARYSNPNPTYKSHSFSITAAANAQNNDDVKAAWKAYGASVESGKAPKLNVVYSVKDYQAAPTTYTVTYKSNYTDGPEDATESVTADGTPTGPETAFTREGYELAGWSTANDGEAAALSSFTITEATTLYAIWNEIIDPYFVYSDSEGCFWIGKDANNGLDGVTQASEITALTIKDVDVADVATVVSGWVKVTWADFVAAGGEDGGTFSMDATIKGVKYHSDDLD